MESVFETGTRFRLASLVHARTSKAELSMRWKAFESQNCLYSGSSFGQTNGSCKCEQGLAVLVILLDTCWLSSIRPSLSTKGQQACYTICILFIWPDCSFTHIAFTMAFENYNLRLTIQTLGYHTDTIPAFLLLSYSLLFMLSWLLLTSLSSSQAKHGHSRLSLSVVFVCFSFLFFNTPATRQANTK